LVGPKEKEAGVGGWGSLVSLFFWPREGTVAGDSGEKIRFFRFRVFLLLAALSPLKFSPPP